MYDGSVIFNTKINTDGFEKATQGMSSKMLDLKAKISATGREISNLTDELKAMADAPVKTEISKSLESDIRKTKDRLSELYAESDRIGDAVQKELEETGLGVKYLDDMLSSNTGWQKVQSQIDATEAKLQGYERELKRVQAAESGITGKDTVEYREKREKLQQLIETQAVYKAKLGEVEKEEGKASSKTKKVAKVFGTLKSAVKKVGKSLGSAFKTGVVNIIKKIGSHAKKSSSQVGGLSKAFNMVKQALAGMFIYQGISKIFDAAKESMQNLAQVSPQTNASLSMLMSALTQLKNSFATAFAPILNVVAPILTQFANMLSNVTDKIAQFFSALSGKSTYQKAIDIQQDYASSVADTTAATEDNTEANEENQKSLAGYDKLNVLQDSKYSSNGVSAAKDTLTPKDMFTTAPVMNSIGSFAQQLKDLINKQDFGAVGEVVAEKINTALKKIKLTKIKKTLKKLASNIADFVNDFIKKINWRLIGTIIADGINTAVVFVATLISGINFKAIGDGVAEALKGLFEKLDVEELGKTFANMINAIINFGVGFLFKFDWKKFGKFLVDSLKSFFLNLNLEDIGHILGKLLEGIATTAQELFTSPVWSILGEKIGKALNNFFSHDPFGSVASIVSSAFTALFDAAIALFSPENFDATQLGIDAAEAINKFFKDKEWWEKAGAAVDVTSKAILDFLSAAISDVNPNDLADSIGAMLSKIDWSYIGLKIAEVISKAVIQAVYGLHSLVLQIPYIGDFMGWITGVNKDNIDEALRNTMDELTIHKDEATGTYYKGRGMGISVAITGDDWAKLKDKIAKYGPEAGQAYAEGGEEGLKAWIEEHGEDGQRKIVEEVKPQASKSGEEIAGELVTAYSSAVKEDDTVEAVFVTKGDDGKKALISSFDKSDISDHFSDVWSGIQGAFNGVSAWFSNTFGTAWDKVLKIFQNNGATDNIVTSVGDTFKWLLNQLIDGLNSIVKVPFDALNWTFDRLKDINIAGFKPFDWLPDISVPLIPKLATGTVVPASYGEFMAILGDNKREPEVVSPLSTMKQAVREVLEDMNINSNDNAEYVFIAQLNGKEIFRENVKQNEMYKKQHRGRSAFA